MFPIVVFSSVILSSFLLLVSPNAFVLAVPSLIALAGGAFCLLYTYPVAALCGVVLMLYVPRGLSPEQIYSVAFDFMLLCGIVGWLRSAATGGLPARLSITTSAMILLMFTGLLSATFAPDLVEARRQFVQYGLALAILLLFDNCVNDRRALNAILCALALGGWALIGFAIGAVLLGDYNPGQRLKIFAMNENLAPTLLVVSIAGVLCADWGTFKPKPALGRAIKGIFIVAVLLIIAASGSRGGAMSVGVMSLCLLVRGQTRFWGLLLIATAAAGTLVFQSVALSVFERLAQAEGGTLGGRAVLWQTGVGMLLDQPYGFGLGNGKREVAERLASSVNIETFGRRESFSTHNPILDVGIDLGIFGVAAYLVVVLWPVYRLLGGSKHLVLGPEAVAVRTGIICVAAGFSVSWIRDGAMNHHPIVFVLLGLMLAFRRVADSRIDKASGFPSLRHHAQVPS